MRSKFLVSAALSFVFLGTATAQEVEPFLQNGASASFVASAVSQMSGCTEPLQFEANESPDSYLKVDLTLFVLCVEEEGEGGILLGFNVEEDGSLTPQFSEQRP